MRHTSVTDMGGGDRTFPETAWSVVLAVRRQGSDFRDSLERLVVCYWKPVYWVLRRYRGCTNEEAKDLTQEFFALFLEKNLLAGVGPERGRFRTYVQVVLKNFAAKRARAARARKRSGGPLVSVDPGICPIEDVVSPEEFLDRAWAREVFDQTVAELEKRYRALGRDAYFTVFARRELDPDPPSYAELGSQLGLRDDQVDNYLRHARGSFRKILRERVRETVSSERDLQDELNHLAAALGRSGPRSRRRPS
jgi:RNA polymerase sigma-70 factor (ECF subfamily)